MINNEIYGEQPSVSEKIALIDMDGSICDFNGSLIEKLDLLASPGESEQSTNLNLQHVIARADLIKKSSGFWKTLPRINDGFTVIKLMREIGFSLNILTKGPYKSTNAWTEKLEWCQEHVPDASVTITQDKGLVYGRVLYDDWPEYILRWLEWRPRGQVVMLDQPWNKDFEHPNVFRFNRSANLDSVGLATQLKKLKEILLLSYER